MLYSQFTLEQLKENFNLDIRVNNLFDSIKPLPPSELLLTIIERSKLIPLSSEKEKSEGIIFPIMIELKSLNLDKISIFSGRRLDVDSEKGLAGECAFIISNKPNLFDIDSPIISLIEAKKNDVDSGVAQCIAQMLGSKMFNEKHNLSFPIIYGCVSTGYEWKFIKLEEKSVIIDKNNFFLSQLDIILGIFQNIIHNY
ncbi:MAG: hypothetical protein U0457_00920 [Candidatus Sericytochromatia bacterium]